MTIDTDLYLRLQDLNLLATASRYELSKEDERKRSAVELARFFDRATRALQPDLFIEAGAKEGAAARRAARFLKDARIVAFEANPYTYERFVGKYADNPRVEYLHLALSDQPGVASFNVRLTQEGDVMADGHGSLLERVPGYEHDFQSVSVEATTLDHFFADQPFETCAIWMDVEGAAEAVLRGGLEVLARTHLVMIEVEDRPYWQGAWTMPDTMRFFFDQGLLPIARDFEYPYQYNLVFAREAALRHDKFRRRLADYFASPGGAETADSRP